MSDSRIELTTGVGRLGDLDDRWLQHYDTVYLGDPFCTLLADNLSQRRDHLAEAIRRVHAAGGRAILTTEVEPWTDVLPRIRDTVAFAVDQGVDGIEVLNLGVLQLVAVEFEYVPIHVNGFVQAFNPRVLAVFERWNVTRLMPYHELTLDEIDRLHAGSRLELELMIQGHIPLGYAEFCMIHPTRVQEGRTCAGDCYRPHWLRHRDLSLRVAGRMTATGMDLCMLHHLPLLWRRGYRHFRIESRLRDRAYRESVGAIYRATFEGIDTSPDNPALDVELEPLRRLCPEGLCNGYYFGEPGMVLR